MIEKIVLDYLEETLDVPVSLEVPEGESEYVALEKTGGYETNYIYYSTIAVQSIAPTLYEAACLNEKVIAAMQGVEALDDVSECRLNSDYNFTDTTTKVYRYQAVFDIVHY